MGCPAPRVYRKKVGGALLKDPGKIAHILRSMRANWTGNLTVKMRIGFEDDRNFEETLKVILKIRLIFLVFMSEQLRVDIIRFHNIIMWRKPLRF